MSTTDDEKQLKLCLEKIIELVNECLQKLKPVSDQSKTQTDNKEDNLLQNSQLNNNIYTFTLNNEENELLDTLTSEIQTILNQYLPHLSKICSNYLLDFLHAYKYDRERQEFTSSLIMGKLHSFHHGLEGLLTSIEAFSAAYNGDLQKVKKFIEHYPTYKNKPGLWKTTLLYSASQNNHLRIVIYLIEFAHCSVNAKNQHDMDFALDTGDTDFTPNSIASSTALHAACYNNHLEMVKYLIEHGADYFIQNQANETPIMSAKSSDNVTKYFENYLILSYSGEYLQYIPKFDSSISSK
jgi:hypothetical protein